MVARRVKADLEHDRDLLGRMARRHQSRHVGLAAGQSKAGQVRLSTAEPSWLKDCHDPAESHAFDIATNVDGAMFSKWYLPVSRRLSVS